MPTDLIFFTAKLIECAIMCCVALNKYYINLVCAIFNFFSSLELFNHIVSVSFKVTDQAAHTGCSF